MTTAIDFTFIKFETLFLILEMIKKMKYICQVCM